MEKPRGNSPPENNPDDKSDKKKKRSKKASDFGVPIAGPSEETKKNEPKERTSFDEALAALVIKEPKETASKPKTEGLKPESDVSETEQEESDAPEDIVSEPKERPEPVHEPVEVARTEETEEVYENLPEYEPKPTEFSGGEVIVDLSGEEPVSERIVLLHESDSIQAPETTQPVTQEAEQQVWQPEQPQEAEAVPVGVPQPTGEVWPPVLAAEATMAVTPEQVLSSVVEVNDEAPEVFRARNEAHCNATPYVLNGEQIATKQDVEDAVYYATKAGQQRGLVAGLIVGGGYEHFKHRRREKKAEKRFKKQSQQLEQARQNYNFGLQEQDRRQTEATARLNAAERRFTNSSPEAVRGVEAGKQPEKLVMRTPEQLAAGEPEVLDLPPEHTLQQSAWHAIEIDKRTGKAVENPTFAYGKEFHNERAKESLLDDDTDDKAPSVMKDIAAASQVPNASTDQSAMPPSDLPSATTQGPPANPKEKAKQAIQSLAKSDSPVNTGPIWPWFVALAVIVILLAILL